MSVRKTAPPGRANRPAAFCRLALAGLGIVLAGGCQPDGSPTQNRLTGALALTLSGLPAGGSGAVTVSGPDGFRRTVTRSETLRDLPIGNYAIAASEVTAEGDRYAPASPSQSVTLVAQAVTPFTVSYAAITGRIQLSVNGVPAGVTPTIQVAGPGGYVHTAAGSELIPGLLPGTYALSPGAVVTGGTSYLATPDTQAVVVAAGATSQASVTYVASAGSLSVTIAGLPSDVPGSVVVSGPNGYRDSLTATRTLTGLAAGLYQITAMRVTAAGLEYSPATPVQSAAVTAGKGASVLVSYSAGTGAPSLDLRIDAVYLTQATQRYDGSVPLVAGRDAYLRVFVLANQGNAAQPPVRVRLYQGSTLVQVYMIPAAAPGVPTTPDQGVLANSWNVPVPGAFVQPGLRILAEVDPDGAVPEADKGNNQFPASGTPAPVDVRALPVFKVSLVPVLQQANGLAGTVTGANLPSFLTDLRQLLPVGPSEAEIHPVYTSMAPVLQSDNGNSAWSIVLNELLALRTVEGSSRYYYGVVKTAYTSGVAGMAFVGGSAQTAVGWDAFPSASNVMAHEIGHTMGRQHAPCGPVAGPDPGFPYAGGAIGVWGLQLEGLALKPPGTSDLMGYCQPAWISDYNWTGMIEYRQSGPGTSTAAGSGDGLLVWGRITADSLVLEPAFRVPASSATGPVPGPNRLELLASDGRVIGAVGFEATEVSDLPAGRERHFAFVVPAGADQEGVAGLRVRAGNQVVTRLGQIGGDPEVALGRVDRDRVAVRWNAARYPMVMVRDPATGQVLSFARGGEARVWARTDEVSLQFSTGTRTISRRERVVR